MTPGCPQTVDSELCDGSVCPSHTEQPLPPSPRPGRGACWSAPDCEQGWELSDQQPTLMKPPRSPLVLTPSSCPTGRTDASYGPWHVAVGFARARARNSGEGWAPHQYLQVSIWKCVFCISLCDICSLQSVFFFGDSNMLPFSLDT